MGMYPDMHLRWPCGPEEAVPKRPKMADGSSDRAPRSGADGEGVGPFVVSLQLAAWCGLPASRLTTYHATFRAPRVFERLREAPQHLVFLSCHGLKIRRRTDLLNRIRALKWISEPWNALLRERYMNRLVAQNG